MWVDTPEVAKNLPPGMGFARRIEAGGWLIGGEGGQLAVYATDGVREVVRAPSSDVMFTHASGRFDDLLAAVGQRLPRRAAHALGDGRAALDEAPCT